jgi:hypothetical protein
MGRADQAKAVAAFWPARRSGPPVHEALALGPDLAQ